MTPEKTGVVAIAPVSAAETVADVAIDVDSAAATDPVGFGAGRDIVDPSRRSVFASQTQFVEVGRVAADSDGRVLEPDAAEVDTEAVAVAVAAAVGVVAVGVAGDAADAVEKEREKAAAAKGYAFLDPDLRETVHRECYRHEWVRVNGACPIELDQ